MGSGLYGSREQASEIMEGGHVSLVSSIKAKMINSSLTHHICKVHEKFYKQNEEMYFPILVSIGPFHRGKDHLKASEDQKWQYLNTLLSRKLDSEARLASCVKVLKLLEQQARKCYEEDILMGSDEFVEMMLLDGCFIIELFFKSFSKGLRRRGDPFLATYEVFLHLKRDLILLENQIPFFVLQHLFSLVPIPKQCTSSLIGLAFRFLKKTVPIDPQYLQEKFGQEIHHLLDLVHQSFIPATHAHQLHSHHEQQLQLQTNIANATKLQKSGIEFKCRRSETFLDIKFHNGILSIPTLRNHDLTEIVLRNLIAIEDCCYDGQKYVTSYAFLMKSLIQSKEDAKLLYKKGILDKGSGKEEDFVRLFNKITVEIDVKEIYYKNLCDQVIKHGKISRSVQFARKVKNHCAEFLREL